jgi:DNA-binding response OmpR family regulator
MADARRLLIIDDDEGLRELFELAMEKEGFLVAGAEDGLKGLAKAAVYKPHLIVLDLMMPNLSGFEVIHRLQQTSPEIPVVIITGYSDESNEQLLRQEPNCVDFLKKPIKYSELAQFVRKLLAGRPE